MKAEDIINWGKLSTHLTGSRQNIRRKSIPKKYEDAVNDYIEAIKKVMISQVEFTKTS